MTEDIKRQITITKDVTLLTKVTCDCCKRELGMFHLQYDPIAGYSGFKRVPDANPVEWYHVIKAQEYDERTEWSYDICPDCFVKWMTNFRDKELGCNDFMELHINHMMDYPQIKEEI